MAEDFISEPLVPEKGTGDVSAMSRGEPGLPASFQWRGVRYVVTRLVSKWKTSGRDGASVYLRRHWFTFDTDQGVRLTVYCLRQAAGSAAHRKSRWWLYTLSRGDAPPSAIAPPDAPTPPAGHWPPQR